MLRRLFMLFGLCIAFGFILPAHAKLPGAVPNIKAELVAETTTPQPGSKVTLAIVMKPDEGWHDYWLNPGGAGTPLELEWNLPAGLTAGPIRAPVPKLLWTFRIANHVYERDHAFLVDLTVSPDIPSGTKLPIGVMTKWSECTDKVCVPGAASLALNLETGSGDIAKTDRTIFDEYRSEIPLPLDQKGSYQVVGEKIRFAIPFPQAAKIETPYFFALTEKLTNPSGRQIIRRSENGLLIETDRDCRAAGEAEREFETRQSCDSFADITGLFKIAPGNGVMVTFRRGTVEMAGSIVASISSDNDAANQTGNLGIWKILAAALFGGLLLNLMPCVFPILGLKALSLAKMGGEEKAARRDALAYSAGVILSVLALGAAMLALRAAGEQVGWAFQLQEPRIVLALFLLMAAITANLAGLFEINVALSASNGENRFGSFGTGVLAAIVATPCTGPFMAAALGAALLLPAAQALLLFAGLGFGLALPYQALAYIPALRKSLPRPGPWLGTFRKIMAIPMALTAAALLWLLWRLSGETGLVVGAASLALLGIALFLLGKTQRQGKAALAASLVAAGIAIVAIIALPREPVTASKAGNDILATETYSDEKLAEYRSKGRSVFVYFTADWCVTCKINEAAAIQREETKRAFEEKNIAILVGDFTRRNPAIARTLARYKRSGVPLYVYFPANGEAQILPQILTPSILADLN